MRKIQFVWLIPILVISLAVAYLYPISGEENREVTIPTDQVNGYKWILNSFVIDGKDVQIIDKSGISIQFDEADVRGSSGCNTYFASYEMSGEYQWFGKAVPDQVEEQIGTGGSISIGAIANTEMACMEPKIMEQETQFLTTLNEVTEFQATASTLKLFNEAKQITLIFELE